MNIAKSLLWHADGRCANEDLALVHGGRGERAAAGGGGCDHYPTLAARLTHCLRATPQWRKAVISESVATGGSRGYIKDKRVDTVVKCCDKGECRRHTEADLEGLEMHDIDKSYLKATRKTKKEVGWENVAEHY